MLGELDETIHHFDSCLEPIHRISSLTTLNQQLDAIRQSVFSEKCSITVFVQAQRCCFQQGSMRESNS